jgi:hypothetical protein
MAQAASHSRHTAETSAGFQASPVRFVVDKVEVAQIFLPVLLFFSCQCHFTNLLHSTLSTR